MIDMPRRRRIALIDRPWLRHRTVIVVAPLDMSPFATIRAVLAEFMHRHPTGPLACRVDERSGRWVPVPASERDAHLDRMLIPTVDPADPADLGAHIAAHLTEQPDLPLVAVASPNSLMIHVSHLLGDAVTNIRLMVGLARADPATLTAATTLTGTATQLRAVVLGARAHHRAWLHHLVNPARPPVADAHAAPYRPAFAGAVLSNAALRDVTRWRNLHAPGVALTSVLSCATYAALTQHGVHVHGDGLYALIDTRAQLPPRPAPRYGNLSKSLYLPADLRDPRSVAAALRAATDSGRAVPAIASAAVLSPLRRPARAAGHAADAPVMLTFNSVPTLLGVTDLPWREPGVKRLVGFGTSVGAGSITVFAVRLRDHMELTASFDEVTAPTTAVRAALEAVADPATTLGSLTTSLDAGLDAGERGRTVAARTAAAEAR